MSLFREGFLVRIFKVVFLVRIFLVGGFTEGFLVTFIKSVVAGRVARGLGQSPSGGMGRSPHQKREKNVLIKKPSLKKHSLKNLTKKNLTKKPSLKKHPH